MELQNSWVTVTIPGFPIDEIHGNMQTSVWGSAPFPQLTNIPIRDHQRMLSTRLYLILLLVMSCLICGCTANALPLDPTLHHSKLTNLSQEFLEDTTGELTIEQILQNPDQQAFERRDGAVVSYGFTTSPVWGKLVLQSSSNSEGIVEIPSTRLDFVDWYQVQDDKLVQHSAYDASCSGQHAALSYPSIRIRFTAQKPVTVFCRIKSLGGSLTIPLLITPEPEYTQVQRQKILISALQNGAAVAIGFLCFIMALILRDKMFAFLGVAAFSGLAYGIQIDNVVAAPGLLIPPMIIRQSVSLSAITFLTMVLTICASYTGWSKLSRIDQSLCVITGFILISFAIASQIFPYQYFRRWLGPLVLITIPAACWTFSGTWRQNRTRSNLLPLLWMMGLSVFPAVQSLQLYSSMPIIIAPTTRRLLAFPIVIGGLCILLISRRRVADQLQLAVAECSQRKQNLG